LTLAENDLDLDALFAFLGLEKLGSVRKKDSLMLG
jgi:hypothetical protein